MRSISLAEGSANGSTTANHGTETTSNGGERLQDADLSALLEIAPGVNKRPVNKKAVKSPPFPVRGRVLAPPAKRKSLTSSPKKDPADKLSRQGSGTSSWGETSSAADGESAADVEMKEANNDSSMLLEKKERTATIEGDATKSMQPPSPKKGKSPKKKKQIPRTSLAGAQAINKAPMWDIHPNVDVILCCPRPKVLERIFTTLATFGVRRIFLIGGAEKVESSYFAGKKLQPDVIEKAMVEGLSQSSYYTRLPVVRILPKLKLHEVLTGLEIENGGPAPKREVAAASRGGPELPPAAPEVGGASNDRLTNKATFCEEGDDPDTTFISDEQIIKQTELGGRHARKLARGYGNLNIVAHPSIESRKLSDIVGDECYASFRGGFLGKRNFPRVTLCIGPEGGWTEGEMETTLKSFERASLGPRVYKTYDATVSLLTLLYEELGI
ncbi:unnamed protein product [Amoebophrya sp. A25]|nr:unnamed protein product [Amoebophrya sp. A25]|eukprot:GSA25T00006467001.1